MPTMPSTATWSKSVQHSQAYNQQTHKWALRDLRRGIESADMLQYLGEHLRRGMAQPQDKALVPGFDMYTYAGSNFNPAFWALPRLEDGDSIHVQDAYEAFVSPLLGVSKEPIMQAAHILRNSGHRSAWFDFMVLNGSVGYWAQAAGGLLALAQQFLPRGQLAKVDREAAVVHMDFDGFVMHVTPEGAYSNRLQTFVPAKKPFRDPRLLVWPFEPTKINSKLIRSLLELVTTACEPGLVGAVLGVVLGIKAGTFNEDHVYNYLTRGVDMDAPKATEAPLPDLHAINPETALERALAILHGDACDPPNFISALYDALVPALYTKASFIRAFGDPDKRRYRRPLSKTRQAWAQAVNTQYRLVMGLPI